MQFPDPNNVPDLDDWPAPRLTREQDSYRRMVQKARKRYRVRIVCLGGGIAAGMLGAWIVGRLIIVSSDGAHSLMPDFGFEFIGALAGALAGYSLAKFLCAIIDARP